MSEQGAQTFELSLGIQKQLKPIAGSELAYQVLHGVHIFLINPQAELQAVFEPTITRQGQAFFEAEKILQDYIMVREFL